MKKIIFVLTVFIVLSFAASSFAEKDITISIDGYVLSPDVKPYIESGRTMVPARIIAENLNAVVNWNPDKNEVTIYSKNNTEDRSLVLTIKKHSFRIKRGSETKIYTNDVKTIIKDGRTMIPFRVVAEFLYAKTEWFPEERVVAITSNAVSPENYIEPKSVDKIHVERLGWKFDALKDTDYPGEQYLLAKYFGILINYEEIIKNSHNWEIDIGCDVRGEKDNRDEQFRLTKEILSQKISKGVVDLVMGKIASKMYGAETLEERYIIELGFNCYKDKEYAVEVSSGWKDPGIIVKVWYKSCTDYYNIKYNN